MVNPFSYLLAGIRAIVLLLIMSVFLLIYLPIDAIFKISTPKRTFWLRRLYVRICNPILGIRVKITGRPYDGTALYVCNHRSLSDPLIIAPYIDAYIIAKSEVSSIPILDSGAKLTGIIYVSRESQDSRSAVRQKMVDTLLSGINVFVYPEGTVNDKIELLEYKKGTFLEADKNNIPIVPLIVEYKHEKDYWDNRKMVSQFFRQFGKLFTNTKLHIGEPMSDSDGLELHRQVMEWSQQQVYDIHKNWDSYLSRQI